MSTLPTPDVKSVTGPTDTTGKSNTTVTISRENQTRTYHGTGNTSADVITDVVRQIISDPYTAEWLPGGKKP